MIQMPARIHLFERLFVIKGITSEHILDDRLLMEEIVHHLGCIKPYKSWETLPTSTGDRRISAVKSIFVHDAMCIQCIHVTTRFGDVCCLWMCPKLAHQKIVISPPKEIE